MSYYQIVKSRIGRLWKRVPLTGEIRVTKFRTTTPEPSESTVVCFFLEGGDFAHLRVTLSADDVERLRLELAR